MNPEYGTGPELSMASRNFCTTEGCDPCIQNINEVQRIKVSNETPINKNFYLFLYFIDITWSMENGCFYYNHCKCGYTNDN